MSHTDPVPGSTGSTLAESGQTTSKTFFGHPWGLANLFGVEMWERFSFYGLQGLVLFYLYHSTDDGGLGMSESLATSIVGAYDGAVFLASIGGAWISDRVLGAEKTLFYSAVLIMLGHMSLALLPGFTGLIIGLVLVAVGSGALKTANSAMVGTLYKEGDPKRDGGFSLFYMGVNIGALIGPLVTGALWKQMGFRWGFGAAAVGMALGLIQYILMRKTTLQNAGAKAPNPLRPDERVKSWGGVIGLTVIIVGLALLFPTSQLSTYVAVIAIVAAIYFWQEMYRSSLVNRTERHRLLGFIPMFLAACVFWSIYQQQFTMVAMYADKKLNLSWGFMDTPASWVQSINPIFIILLAPLFTILWDRLGTRQPSTPVKFGVSAIMLGLGLVPFLFFVSYADHSTPYYMIVVVLFLFTVSELLLSPVGLSMSTKLAPRAYPARMVAMWNLTSAVGTALAGTLAGFYNPESAHDSTIYFITMICVCVVIGAIILAVSKPIVKLFDGVK